MSNFSQSNRGKGLALSETEQLQKDIDDFTKLLEKEKRQLMITEDQIKQVSNEINEKKVAIKEIKDPKGLKTSKPTMNKLDRITTASNVHRVKNEVIKVN